MSRSSMSNVKTKRATTVSQVSPPPKPTAPPKKNRMTMLGMKKTSSTKLVNDQPASAQGNEEQPQLYVKIESGRNFTARPGFIYFTVNLEGVNEQSNYVLADSEPRWDEEFVLLVKQKMSCLEVTVFFVDEEGLETTYLGEVNVPIHTLPSHRSVTEWYPLTPSDSSGAPVSGEVHIVLYNSLQRSAMDALRELKEVYSDFLSILSSDFTLLGIMFDLVDPSDADRVGGSVVSMFSYLGKELELFDWAIREEVDCTSSPSVLFRSNSMAIRLVSVFSKLTATSYLKSVLQSLIEDTIAGDPSRFEVDVSRLPAGAAPQLKKNQKNLQQQIQLFMNAIFSSVDQVPIVLRRVCALMNHTVESKFPGSAIRAVGGLFFLRFVCPAIVAPASFGLLQKHPSGASHRALVLVAKVLQNAANMTSFKESEMECFNEFLQEKQVEMTKFLDSLSHVTAETPEGEPLAILRPAAVADSCIVIAKLFRQHLTKIKEEEDHANLADELDKILKELAANELVHERPYNASALDAQLRKDGIVKLVATSGLTADALASLIPSEEDDEDGVLNISRPWTKPYRPGSTREMISLALSILMEEGNRAVSGKSKSGDWASVSKTSAEFKKLEVAVCELQKADVSQMLSQSRKVAFWLNVYHTLLLHILFVNGTPGSSHAKKLFYSHFRYRVGSFTLSLLDIENGILRGNPFIKGSSRQWGDSDKRRQLSLPLDYRIVYAISNLTEKSPVIQAYNTPTLDAQLDAVISHFLSRTVEIDPVRREIQFPKQFSRNEMPTKVLLTWIYNFLGTKKKMDVLYLQRRSCTITIAKKGGKVMPPRGVVPWYQGFDSSMIKEEDELTGKLLQAANSHAAALGSEGSSTNLFSGSSGNLGSLSAPSSPPPQSAPTAAPVAAAAAVDNSSVPRRMERQASVLDENIMRESLSGMMQKVAAQVYDCESVAQNICTSVCKTVSVTAAFQAGKVIREVKMELLKVQGITWTAASLEKFKQQFPVEEPQMTRLQQVHVSAHKQVQLLKLMCAIQTAVVDIRFLLENVLTGLQNSHGQAFQVGRVIGDVKNRLEATLVMVNAKNAEMAPFEELITLESAIAPEVQSVVELIQGLKDRVSQANMSKEADCVYIFLLASSLTWIRGQLETLKPSSTPFKPPSFDASQISGFSQAKLLEAKTMVGTALEKISAKLQLVKQNMLQDATAEKLMDLALVIRNCSMVLVPQR